MYARILQNQEKCPTKKVSSELVYKIQMEVSGRDILVEKCDHAHSTTGWAGERIPGATDNSETPHGQEVRWELLSDGNRWPQFEVPIN